MSLTNPNKPVTEARLQEFYHRIKSYLGFTEMSSEDISEVISPLPSVQPRYHKYSTEEHIVGEWIDGKTLYEKTVQIPSSAISSHTFTDSDLTNADTKLIVSGYYYTTDTILSLNQCETETASNTTYYTRIGFRRSDNSLYLYVVGYNNVQGAVVTLQYTKSE